MEPRRRCVKRNLGRQSKLVGGQSSDANSPGWLTTDPLGHVFV